jgi:hypothetical protein
MNLPDRAEDHGRGALDRPAHQVPGTVAVLYLGEPLSGRHGLAVSAGGYVAAGQHAGKRVRRRFEVQAQDVGESAFVGFDDGAGVMGDQLAWQGVGVLGVAQVPGAIELMQARAGKAGGVADVVQPRGGFQQIGVRAENGCQAADPGAGPPAFASQEGWFGVPVGRTAAEARSGLDQDYAVRLSEITPPSPTLQGRRMLQDSISVSRGKGPLPLISRGHRTAGALAVPLTVRVAGR